MKTRVEWVTAAQVEAERRAKMTDAGFEAAFIEGVDWMFRQQKLEQCACSTMRESLSLMHSREFDAWSHTTDEDDFMRMDKNMKTIVATIKAIDNCKPVS